jgi:hypothetical protein
VQAVRGALDLPELEGGGGGVEKGAGQAHKTDKRRRVFCNSMVEAKPAS